jgi:hypothetical protein
METLKIKHQLLAGHEAERPKLCCSGGLLSAGISNSARGQKYGSHYIRYRDIRLRTGYQDAQPLGNLGNLQTQMPSAARLRAGDEAVGKADALRV